MRPTVSLGLLLQPRWCMSVGVRHCYVGCGNLRRLVLQGLGLSLNSVERKARKTASPLGVRRKTFRMQNRGRKVEALPRVGV